MSYQVIARKWRPQKFEDVTGQEVLTRTLQNSIEHARLHHAYLFSGARGVGKTTTARLVAKALNCHKATGPTPTPCAMTDATACASCREIAEGRSMDVLVAFRIIRKDDDDSVIILWKLLKKYPKPELARNN